MERIRHVHDPKKRMARVWEFCKGKMVCEADEPRDDEAEVDPSASEKRRHGGCGHIQPNIRKEGLKLFLVYKKIKDEDEMVITLSVITRHIRLTWFFNFYYRMSRLLNQRNACSPHLMSTTVSKRFLMRISNSLDYLNNTPDPIG